MIRTNIYVFDTRCGSYQMRRACMEVRAMYVMMATVARRSHGTTIHLCARCGTSGGSYKKRGGWRWVRTLYVIKGTITRGSVDHDTAVHLCTRCGTSGGSYKRRKAREKEVGIVSPFALAGAVIVRAYMTSAVGPDGVNKSNGSGYARSARKTLHRQVAPAFVNSLCSS
jgi:hypothetical protein